MPKKDFIMQLIAQLRALLPYILDLARSGNYTEAHAVIDQAVRELMGIGSAGVVNMPDDFIIEALKSDQAISWEEKSLFLATIMNEEAQLFDAEGEEGAAYSRRVKALNLLLIVKNLGAEDVMETDLLPDIEELIESLAGYVLPGQTTLHLMNYYEDMGKYAAAEDILFDWLAENPTLEPNPLENGLAFYERLQLKSDEELILGNLSRDEIKAGVLELREYGAES